MQQSIEIKCIEARTPQDIEAGNSLNRFPGVDDALVYCRLEIGEIGRTGTHVFHITVLTGACRFNDSILNSLKAERWPRFLKLPNYSAETVEQKLHQMVAKCDRGTWDRSLPGLRKMFFWEYEGMMPDP